MDIEKLIGITGLAFGGYCILYGKHIAKKLFPNHKKSQSQLMIISFAGLIWLLSILSFSKKEPNIDVPSQITVSVHGKKGKDDLVLPSRGKVTLTYGNAKVTETINHRCEAVFKQIPGEFFLEKALVEIHFSDPQGEPYFANTPDSQYQLTRDGYIPLQVELTGLNQLRGVVKARSTGQLIEGVRITIGNSEATSNAFGQFTLDVNEDDQKQYPTVKAYKDGFAPYERQRVPLQTKQELPIWLEPKKAP